MAKRSRHALARLDLGDWGRFMRARAMRGSIGNGTLLTSHMEVHNVARLTQPDLGELEHRKSQVGELQRNKRLRLSSTGRRHIENPKA